MVALVTMLVLLFGGPQTAHADNVDKLVKDLGTASDYKLRLSAASSLAKLGDQRAIAAFIKALVGTDKKGKGKDKEKTVRGAAAVGLGKVVTSETSAEDKKKAMDALKKGSKDKDSFVKKQAKKALAKLKKLDDAAVTVASGGVYVDMGPMTVKIGLSSPTDAELKAQMKKITEKTFNSNSKAWLTLWPGGKAPKQKDLDAKNVTAFEVEGTLNSVTQTAKGSGTNVSCKVSMLIASYPSISIMAMLNGGATVTASNSASDIEAATYDCVNAVIEDMVIKKMIPAIQAKL